MKDPIGRFDGRAEDYARYRPGYPVQLAEILERDAGLCEESAVADIGSGTGILAELLLERGTTVYCVEPNREMRKIAEKNLKRYAPKFVSVNGTAEATGLAAEAVDLVTVGQALHWFEPERASREFQRILREGGSVAVVYNHRRETGEVEEAVGRIVRECERDKADVPDVDDEYVARFLGNRGFRKWAMANGQTLDAKGMLGRLASASYMPRPGTPGWKGVEREVHAFFAGRREELVTLHYDTVLYLGQVTPRQP